MSVPNRLNSELVVVEWIKTIPELATIGVATQLPTDNTTWGPTGFAVVNVLSGDDDNYLPVDRPVIQVEAFAVKPSTGKPLWNVCSNILSAIAAACRDEATIRRLLTVAPGGVSYGQARVMECYPIHPQLRLYKPAADLSLAYGDEVAQYGRKSQDYQFHWVGVG